MIVYSGLAWTFGCNVLALDGELYLLDKRVDPDCWLRSWFKSPQGRLVVSLFKDLNSYGRFTGATFYVACLD